MTLFIIGILILAVKLFFFAIKMAWGLTKVVAFVVFLPVILIGMLLAGLLSAAFPVCVLCSAALSEFSFPIAIPAPALQVSRTAMLTTATTGIAIHLEYFFGWLMARILRLISRPFRLIGIIE